MADSTTTITDVLIGLLETFKYPVFRQGSLADNTPYPATFITFWGYEDEHSAYDNETQIVENQFDVNVYSSDPDTAYSVLDQIRSMLKTNGWTILQRAYDVQSDENTHIGRGMEIAYLSTEN